MLDMHVIDAWAQCPNERFMAQPWLETLNRWTGRASNAPAITVDHMLAAMDFGRVARAVLCAWTGPHGPLIDNEEVAAMVEAHPDRFVGAVSVDLNDPCGAVSTLRHFVTERGFKALRVVPWLWRLPPNDRRYYPLYVACSELGIPLLTQIGHTGPLCPSEPGRPIPYLEDVLLDFPSLTVVGGHVGYPWIHEVLSLARKFPNFHVDTSAYVVERLPMELVDFMRGSGRTRVLFGSNFPMLGPARCLRRLDALSIDEETKSLFLYGNAERVFGLAAGNATKRCAA